MLSGCLLLINLVFYLDMAVCVLRTQFYVDVLDIFVVAIDEYRLCNQ